MFDGQNVAAADPPTARNDGPRCVWRLARREMPPAQDYLLNAGPILNENGPTVTHFMSALALI
jgi:hypothetical protein